MLNAIMISFISFAEISNADNAKCSLLGFCLLVDKRTLKVFQLIDEKATNESYYIWGEHNNADILINFE